MKKSGDPLRKELRYLLDGEVNRQSTRSIRRIAGMFEDATRPERTKLLQHLFTCIEKDYLLSGKPRKARENFTLLGTALGEQALAWGDIDYLMKFCVHKAKDIGEALFSGQNVMVIAFYRFVGSTPEAALRLCRMLSKAQIQHVEAYDRRVASGTCTTDEYFDDDYPFIPDVIHLAAVSPCTDSKPQKEWLLRIIELADAGNREAENFLRWVLEILDYEAIYLHTSIEIITQEELDGRSLADEIESCVFQKRDSQGKTQLIIPNRLLHVVTGLVNKIERQTAKDLARCESFGAWFMNHRNELAAVFDARQQEIVEKPRYGIRPYGFDSAVVEVSPLNCIGIQSFSLHVEGERFPDVKIEVHVKKTGAGLCSLWAHFRDFTLQCNDHLLDNWQDFDHSFLRAVFEYVIVDALFHIVCREPRRNKAGEIVQRAAYREDRITKQQVVRPFLRRLPLGYRASDHARKLAFIYQGWALPEGVTFVQSHSRWVGLPSTKPAPLFTYTDESIMKSIE